MNVLYGYKMPGARRKHLRSAKSVAIMSLSVTALK